MAKAVFNEAIVACFTEILTSQTERIAKATEACVKAGGLAEAVSVSMEIEQIIYEADYLDGH